jgi:hypothetical protein
MKEHFMSLLVGLAVSVTLVSLAVPDKHSSLASRQADVVQVADGVPLPPPGSPPPQQQPPQSQGIAVV